MQTNLIGTAKCNPPFPSPLMPELVDTHDKTCLRVDKRAARIAGIERRIGLQSLDTPGNFNAADDPAGGRVIKSPWMTEGDYGAAGRIPDGALERPRYDVGRILEGSTFRMATSK